MKAQNVAWLIIIGIVVLGFIMSQFEDKKETVYFSSKSDAFLIAKSFVEQSLKSPKSAEFALMSDSKITRSDEVYTIESYVDSTNSFNAMIRTKFTCVVKHNGNDKWSLVSLDTEK